VIKKEKIPVFFQSFWYSK